MPLLPIGKSGMNGIEGIMVLAPSYYASVTAAQMPSERLMVIDFDILLLPSSIYYLSTFCLMKKASARADMMALKTLTAADMKV